MKPRLPTKAKRLYFGFLGFTLDWEHRFGNKVIFSEPKEVQ
jgi:hypothetical protein